MTSCPPILVLTDDALLVTFLRQEYCGSVLSMASPDERLSTTEAILILVDRDLALLEEVQRTHVAAHKVFIQSADMPYDAGISENIYAVLRHPLPPHSTGLLLKRLALVVPIPQGAADELESDAPLE